MELLLIAGIEVFLILAVMPFILLLIALVDVLRSDFKDSGTKIVWVVVIVFMPLLGSVLYFILGRRQKALCY